MHPRLIEKAHQKVFDTLYSRSLVYNTCWEDPAVDRAALDLGPDDVMLVITSAGCNVLDYALTGVRRIHAVDANPRQTALLELKIAGIRALGFDDFFALFGDGRHAGFEALYRRRLRGQLSAFAREFWDRHERWFRHPRRSFYFFGLSGQVARAFHAYLRLRPGLRDAVHDLLACRDLAEQRRTYDEAVAPRLWGRGVDWVLSRQFTMSMLGVPGAQHEEVRRQNPRGVAGFVRESVDYVFRDLPAWTNYFWRLYLHGGYSRDCAPEYLVAENFAALKRGRVDCIEPRTSRITEFLGAADEPISRFVLLDHMDWMGAGQGGELADEWRAILGRAAPGARIIFRSAHAFPGYLRPLVVRHRGRARPLLELLEFRTALARRLQRLDRVHTYAGFHIADVAA